MPFGTQLARLGLIESLEERHGDPDDPNSWFRSSHHIEGVWVSDHITVESRDLLPFSIGFGDQNPIIIKLSTVSFIG